MTVRDYFPWTKWLVRRMSSRRMIKLYLGLIVLVCAANAWFRISSFLMVREFLKVTKSISTLSLGQSGEPDVLTIVPSAQLEVSNAPSSSPIANYSGEFSNWDGMLLRAMQHRWGRQFHDLAYFLGYRAMKYTVTFQFTDGILSGYSYFLWIDDGSFGVPGLVMVGTRAQSDLEGFSTRNISSSADENPDYQVTEYHKWPDRSLEVAITSATPLDLRRHAFDLRLNCVVTIAGCKTAGQILPLVLRDKQEIEAAKDARLKSQAPCSPRILRNLARVMPNILLVRILDIKGSTNSWSGEKEEFAESRMVEVLRKARYENYERQEPLNDSNFSNLQLPETGWGSIKRGDLAILFATSGFFEGQPCTVVPASPENVELVRRAIAFSIKVPPGKQGNFDHAN